MKKEQGFSIIEVLLSVVVLSLFVMATVGAILYGEEGNVLSGKRNRAALIASEGIEADRSIRDATFSALLIGTHGLSINNNRWLLTGLSDLTDIFTRSEQIATASGSDDKRDVTSSATWTQNLQRTGSVSIYTRFTNWFRKFGNWASASQQSSLNLTGNQAGNKVAVSGHYAYLVRNGGIPNFAVIDVTNPAAPTLAASLTLANTPQNIYIVGTIAYVASSANAEELEVIDISNPLAPSQVGLFNATGSVATNGVFAVGTTVYLTCAGNTSNFLILNVSNPAAPTQTSIMSLNGPLYEVVVMGNFAYVSSGDNASELQVINVSNPASPALVGSLNLAGNADAITIAGFQSPDTVFLGQNDGTVSIVDVTTPTTPVFLSSFAAGTSTNDITFGLSDGYLLLATAHTTQEFEVWDISTLTAPTLLGVVNLGNALNGIAYDQVRDRVYVVGTANSAEFIVLQPL